MMLWPSVLLVSLCVVQFEPKLAPFSISAWAQETSAPDDGEVEESQGGDEEEEEEVGESVLADSAKKVQDNLGLLTELLGKGGAGGNPAKELKEKLGLLTELLVKKHGAGADPALKERLDGLSKQLENIGASLGGLDTDSSARNNAEQQVLAACVALAMWRAGPKHTATFKALRRMASGSLKAEEASELPLMRMVAVCVTGLSDTEYQQFTAGKLGELPKSLADKAALPAAKAEVLALENEIPGVWDQLVTVASPMYDTMKEAAGKESGTPPIMYGLLAAIPLLLGFAFLGKKFFDMQRDLQEKNERKKEKAAKKKGK
mmetsp:Transcript_26078/g.35172  ORF Transcript_26078/g.35172 Transcript_26078/m.35172 type:complete len:318 (+) Transcript_26078:37-990(+)